MMELMTLKLLRLFREVSNVKFMLITYTSKTSTVFVHMHAYTSGEFSEVMT